MQVQFKSGYGMYSYHDLPQTWIDGDVREISDEQAKYLTESFPKNFTIVVTKAASFPPENKAVKNPGKHK